MDRGAIKTIIRFVYTCINNPMKPSSSCYYISGNPRDQGASQKYIQLKSSLIVKFPVKQYMGKIVGHAVVGSLPLGLY